MNRTLRQIVWARGTVSWSLIRGSACRFPSTAITLKDGRELALRLLAIDDADALADFYDSLPRETWRFYCPPRLTREDAARRAAEADAPNVVCLVAEKPGAGVIAGYDWYRWKEESSPSSVFGICLREAYRGAGLGRALMTRLLAIAADVGPPVMRLTVQLSNPRAVALYQKMGFCVVREQIRKPVGDFAAEPEYAMEQRVRGSNIA
jgi:ribosomal protein S18 acetylase RimI-like enzyme